MTKLIQSMLLLATLWLAGPVAASEPDVRVAPYQIEMSVDAITWEALDPGADLHWAQTGLSDTRHFRLHYRIPESLAPRGRLAFSPGVVSSIYTISIDGQPVRGKGTVEPQIGLPWTGRFEVIELPGPVEAGQSIEVTLQIISYSSKAGIISGQPVIGALSDLEAERLRRDWWPALVLVAFLVALGLILVLTFIFCARSQDKRVSWIFAGLVLGELSDLLLRAAILFDWTSGVQYGLAAISGFLWWFLGYPLWLWLITLLANFPISKLLRRYTIIAGLLGLIVGGIGFRENTEDLFYLFSTTVLLAGFVGGWVLLIRICRARARLCRPLLALWIAGNLSLLVDLINVTGIWEISEAGWWISPVNIAFFIPVIGLGWLVFQRLLGEHDRAALLADRIVTVQEDERRFLARELHDGVSQNLQALKLQLELGEDATISAAERAEVIRWLDTTSDEVRHAARHLHPSILERLSLPDAIEEYAGQLRRAGVEIDVTTAPDLELSPMVAGNLYRIVQEAIANAIHHGQARRIEITLTRRSPHDIRLTIHDDGRGIAPEQNASGIGCRTIQERVALCGGTAKWEDERGTKITVTVPQRNL